MLEELSNFRRALPSFRSFRNLSPLARRETKWGMLFLSPWIFGFLAFTLIPMLATLFFSFANRYFPAARHRSSDEQQVSQRTNVLSQHVLHALYCSVCGSGLPLGRYA